MPLIDLTTNLKSLKFGKDRPGGGSSNQPYIQKDIPDSGDPSNIFNTGGPDSVLRGGLIAPLKAANDVSRLTQMFFDLKSPTGLLFTAKQNELSRLSVKTEASEGGAYGGGNVNQGIYSPSSTIGQAAVGFTGAHLNFLGLNPSGESPLGLNNYFDVVKNKDKEDNRLVTLLSNEDPVNILQYSGGPGSVLGIGDTSIIYADQRTGDKNAQAVTNPTQFYIGERKNGQTSLTSPPLGVANRWFDFTGNEDVVSYPELTTGGGYTYELDIYNSTTKSGSLELNDQLGSGSRPINKTVDDFVDPIGASNKFEEFGGEGLTNTLSKDGGYTWTNVDAQSTTNPNSLSKNESLPAGSFKYDSDKLKFYNLLGASKAEKLSLSQNDIGDNGQLTDRYYGRVGLNDTLSKNNPTGKPLSGTGAYLAGIQNSTTDRTGLYNGSLDYAKLLPSGSSQTYINLTQARVNNNFYQADSFNVYTQGATFPDVSSLQSANNSRTLTQRQLILQNPISDGSRGGLQQDFRTKVGIDATSTISSLAPSYNPNDNKTKEGRLKLGNPGTKKSVGDYTISTTLDEINASAMYTASAPNHSEYNDLIQFSIGIVQNGNTKGESQYMHFRAFLDKFDDKFSSDWGSTQYVGRAEKFFNYKGFSREMGLGFKVYAQSRGELLAQYKKLNYLASSQAPTYTSAGFMQGNLARITVGSYIVNQLGIIQDVSYTIPNESPWEIAIDTDGNSDPNVAELPFMINVSLSFTPIHEFIPRLGQEFIYGKSKIYKSEEAGAEAGT